MHPSLASRSLTWLRFKQVQALMFLGLTARAISTLAALLRGSPRYAPGWRYLAFLYAQSGADDRAFDAFRRALDLDASDDATRFNLGFLLHRHRRFEEAIVEFERLLQTSPGNDRAWYGLGLCRYERGEFEPSVTALREAARLQYFNPHAGRHLALALHKLGRHEEVATEYERIRSFDPKAAEVIRRETGVAPPPK
jgi:tetratricopeptide (TPR) repeat protein